MNIRSIIGKRGNKAGLRKGFLMGFAFSFLLGAYAVGDFTPDAGVYAEGLSGGDFSDVAVDPTGKGEGYSAVLYDNRQMPSRRRKRALYGSEATAVL